MKERRTVHGMLIVSLLGIVLAPFCAKPPSHYTWMDFFIGKVYIINSNGAVERAEIKKELFVDDTVRTGGKSYAFIQHGADILVQVFEDTELKMSAISDKLASSEGSTLLDLGKGSASFFVERLSAGGSFEVRTRAVKTAVRGTLFHIRRAGPSTSVAVSDGEVGVASIDGAFEEFTLGAGWKAEIEGKDVRVSKLDKGDLVYFKDLVELRPIAGIQRALPENVERYFRWRLGLEPAGEKEPVVEEKGAIKEEGKPGVLTPPEEKSQPVKARLVVTRLVPNGIGPAEAEDISRRLYQGIVSAKGASQVLYRATGDRRSANRALTGRVSLLGQSRIIAVSVVDGQKGTVLYTKTATVRDQAQRDAQIDGIAKEIGALGSLWE